MNACKVMRDAVAKAAALRKAREKRGRVLADLAERSGIEIDDVDALVANEADLLAAESGTAIAVINNYLDREDLIIRAIARLLN